MTLKSFLTYHSRIMLETFRLSHYEVSFCHAKMSDETALQIDVDTEYLRADVQYGKLALALWRLKRKRELLSYLAHEITHILTEQLWTSKSNAKNHEQVTEHLSRLLFRLYERKL